ncbi:MAG TPA: hypothetical protein EYM37_05105 [Methylophaga aminisulfidivorans]|uniref:sulfotransferase family 2 domain-containing protein n=1 Tax=Methylophaga TaxID=40222 RepID=UPI00175D0F8A|nr:MULTISPECIES: sulfotransferase family 2 domain-containing protein [Methylophaga]HIC46054.1 hypothetical protein [Methylophaga sp.]HIM39301.1 hypothetical protein [Methylophaga aminisulfidivorans]
MNIKNRLVNSLPVSFFLWLRWFKYRSKKRSRYEFFQAQRQIETTDTYSYKPFDDTKSIFIHIPKCAGVSITTKLYGNLAGGHLKIEDYTRIFSPREFLNYYKFTVVRNPWDRLVSSYHFLSKGGMNDTDKLWSKENISQYTDFKTFVKEWVTPENVMKYYHFIPQTEFIFDVHNAVKPDFIAFLETLDDDFTEISHNLNIAVEIDKKNQSNHDDYKSYYDAETINIVAEVYERDIQLLGYNFDNSSLKKQVCKRNLGQLTTG